MIKVIITANNVSSIDHCTRQTLEKAGFYVEEYPEANALQKEEFISLLQGADAVIAGLEKYTREILERVPTLKLIARRGVGTDNIDMTVAKERGITITRTEGIVGAAVAELIMTYILEHARMLGAHNRDMKQGVWNRRLSGGVKGKTLGLIGFGSIAKETAIRANAFGMKVLCYYRHRDPASEQSFQVEYKDFDSLVAASDYISINVPLTEDTKHMFCWKVFDRMKSTSVLLNTARSGIVCIEDLVLALQEGKIAGAYLDVYDQEPCTDSPLSSCYNAVLTPHIGTFTKETFLSMNNRCAGQIMEFFN